MPGLFARLDPRRSLRARIGLSFALAALVFSVIGGLYEARQQEEAVREATASLLQRLATSFANELRSDIHERFEDLRFIVAQMESGEAGSGTAARPGGLTVLLTTLQRRHPELAGIVIADTAGNAVATTEGIAARDFSAEPWFRQGRTIATFGSIHTGSSLAPRAAAASRFVEIAVPIVDAEGTSRGIVAAALAGDWLTQRVEQIGKRVMLPGGAEVFLLAGDSLASGQTATGRRITFGSAQSGHSIETIDDRSFLQGYQRIATPQTGTAAEWTVVLRQPAEAAFVSAKAARDRALLLFAVLVSVFGLVGWWIAGRIVRPVESITFAAERMRAGEATGFPTFGRRDEVGTLGETLELLVRELNASIARTRLGQEQLAIKRAQLENIIETMAEGLTICDRDGVIVRVNAATEAILGVTRDEILGKRRDQMGWRRVSADGAPMRTEDHQFDRLKAGEERIDGLEYDIVKPNGTRIQISANAVALREADGTFAGMVQTYVDIARRRRAEDSARHSDQIMAATLAAALDSIITIDHRGNIVEFNEAAERCFGQSRERVIGQPMAGVLVPPRLREKHHEGFERYLATGEARMLGQRIEMSALGPEGREIDIELAVIRVPGEDPPLFTAFARDITERKRAEAAVRRAQERLDRALDASNVALFDVDVASGRVYLSESWSTMLGRERAPTETTVGELLETAHEDERQKLWDVALAAIKGERESYDLEHRVRTAGGDYIWILSRARVVGRDAEGRAVRLAGTNVDITERKRAEQRIQYLATRDALTDLTNRALFGDQLEKALRTAVADSARLAVLSVGLDRFTNINDSLGHGAGDRVLRGIADRIAACVGEHDLVARPGGDEFLVLLTHLASPYVAAREAEILRDAISMPLALDAHNLVVTASVGIAVFPEDGETPGAILRNADTALHHAKVAGGNLVQFFAENMNVAAQARLQTEGALRRGLERNEFVLHYQPQVDLGSGRTIGYEALLRWQHPKDGLVSPGRFLPVAEDTGLILALGEVALREACRQAAQWPPGLRVSVNVSARQFRYPGIVEMVRTTLAQTGFDPRRLELEIVENAIMDHGPETIATLKALGEMGVELAIDDFGTGYSSLSYLRRLPIDTVKIDQSFVADLPGSAEAAAIVRAVIGLAHGLHLSVVAEGVETKAQAEYLRTLGCDHAQGYYFSRPQPPENLQHDGSAKVVRINRSEAA